MTTPTTDRPRVLDLEDVGRHPIELVGGKASGLALMLGLGLRVPPAFVVTTEVWRSRDLGGMLPADALVEIDAAVSHLEELTGRRLGDPDRPLMVSVRSGAPASMPGMMDTVLDLGLTVAATSGLANEVGEAVAAGCRERFHRSYHRTVGTAPPDDAHEQLRTAVTAVFASWDTPRARTYRELHDLAHGAGTAVVVQAMVLGNRGPTSGAGVVCSRDPDTGRPGLAGDYRIDAQGDDVVDGRHATSPISDLVDRDPALGAELAAGVAAVEASLRDAVDVEFTVEDGTLHYLQCRVARRAAPAAVRIAVDLVDEGTITIAEALDRVTTGQLAAAELPTVDAAAAGPPLATGTGACPGVTTGVVCLSSERVDVMATDGRPVVLVRPETSPEDLPGMIVASGLLTSTGGLVSHAAVVARELDLPTVVGVADLVLDEPARTARLGSALVAEGDEITIDGAAGTVHLGVAPVRDPAGDRRVARFRAWRDRRTSS